MFETTIKISGMMCGMCEAHVNDAVRRAVPVKKVSSSHAKGETVILSEQQPDEQALRAAIRETGYDVLSVSTKPYEKRGLFGLLKK
ncbi:MAG: cation transporter [Oscillospiraceae bacterium]|nr:cation transporter [Oscillospiraceae bacterium]